ncbi:SLBB domain-containing protein [candidate division KSB1 bacterium]|nr:SLBB domain-containing protein [candidate division KSB1 bacterium]
MRKTPFYLLLALALVITVLTTVSLTKASTKDKQQTDLPRGAQYFLGTTDELLIRVNIWGFVRTPGQYMVPSETDLISLLSFAGGPMPSAKLSKIKIVRKSNNSNKEEIIQINVKKYIEDGNIAIPRLKPDDTIIVKPSRWHYFSTSLEFVTRVATVVQVIGWWMYYMDK